MNAVVNDNANGIWARRIGQTVAILEPGEKGYQGGNAQTTCVCPPGGKPGRVPTRWLSTQESYEGLHSELDAMERHGKESGLKTTITIQRGPGARSGFGADVLDALENALEQHPGLTGGGSSTTDEESHMAQAEEMFPETPIDKASAVLAQLQAGVDAARKKLERAAENLDYAELMVSKQQDVIDSLTRGGTVDPKTGEVLEPVAGEGL